MSTTDGKTSAATPYGEVEGHLRLKEGLGVITLAGGLTLTGQYANHLRIDPGGAARVIVLPAEATSAGMWFDISNFADAAEKLTVNNDAGGLVVDILQNRKSLVMCDGVTWYHTGLVTISIS